MFPDCCGSQTLGPNFPGLRGGKLSTPTVDGSVVYALSKMGDLFCLDAATGKVKWEVNVNRKLGFALPTWSFSSSPLALRFCLDIR